MDIIIPLAGEGDRFFALQEYHKSLLPYKGKEILCHILDGFLGIKKKVRFIFVVKYKKENIINFLLNYFSENNNIEYVITEQKSPKNGPLAAIYYALNFIKNRNVLIFLGDAILQKDQKIKYDTDFLGIRCIKEKDFNRHCFVDDKLNFYDKPIIKPPTNLALNGIYYFTCVKLLKKSTAHIIENDEPLFKDEYQISQMLQYYARKKSFKLMKVNILDLGTLEKYLTSCTSLIFDPQKRFQKLCAQNPEKMLKLYYHQKILSELKIFNTFKLKNLLTKNKNFNLNAFGKIEGISIDYIFLFENTEEVSRAIIFPIIRTNIFPTCKGGLALI